MTSQEILNAASGPAIGTFPELEQVQMLEAIIKSLYLLQHLDAERDEQRVKMAATLLQSKITERCSYLTLGEIRLALESGVYGEFGKDNFLTPANFVKWITAFIALPERAEAIREKMKNDRAEEKKYRNLLPPADKAARDEAFRKTAPLAAWEEFKRDPFYYEIYAIGYGHALYEALRSSGKMQQVTPQTLDEAKRRATIRYNRVHNESDPFAKVVNDAQALGHYVETELVKLYFRSLYDRGQNLTI